MKYSLTNPFTSPPVKQPIAAEVARLKKWNLSVAVLLALEALAVLLLSVSKSFPVTVSFLTPDALTSKVTGETVLAPATHVIGNVNIVYLIAGFLLVPAIFRALMVSSYRRRYEADLKGSINTLRWFEYALTAGLMIVVVGLIFGVYDAGSLIMLFTLTAISSLLGLALEIYRSARGERQQRWLLFGLSVAVGLVPWLVLALYMVATNVFGNGVATYTYFIYGTMFLLAAAAALTVYLQHKKQGKWANYYYAERSYLVIILLATTLLAWQVYAGALHA